MPVTVTSESSVVLPNLVTISTSGAITSHAASSATYGNGLTLFRVDVGDASAMVGSNGIVSHCSAHTASCPTGTITLLAPGTALGGVVLTLNNQGYAEVQTLAPGMYSVTAQYSGDASYNASTGTVSFTIVKALTTVTSGYAGTPVQYGNPEQIAADVLTNSTGVAPTGTFQFYVDGQPAGSPQNVYESAGYSSTSTAAQYAWADAQTTWPFL